MWPNVQWSSAACGIPPFSSWTNGHLTCQNRLNRLNRSPWSPWYTLVTFNPVSSVLPSDSGDSCGFHGWFMLISHEIKMYSTRPNRSHYHPFSLPQGPSSDLCSASDAEPQWSQNGTSLSLYQGGDIPQFDTRIIWPWNWLIPNCSNCLAKARGHVKILSWFHSVPSVGKSEFPSHQHSIFYLFISERLLSGTRMFWCFLYFTLRFLFWTA